nr:hypothetical protein [Clostridia bacterium]
MKKFITSLLLIAMLTTSLISCGGGGTGTPADTTAPQDTTAAETTTVAETSPLDNLPDKKFDGYEFRILSRNPERGWKWESIDIASENENGEPINDAVFTRNRELEEEYDVKVKNVAVKAPVTDLNTAILAGEDRADIVTDGLSYLFQTLPSKYTVNFNELPYINMEAEWWDQRMISELSIKNKVYFMTGDISIMDNAGTWVLGFNKDMVKEFALSDPYELVADGKWTYENMYEMMKKVPADLDGNGSMDDFDRYAITGQIYNNYVFMVGSGASITTKDDKDLPVLSIYN